MCIWLYLHIFDILKKYCVEKCWSLEESGHTAVVDSHSAPKQTRGGLVQELLLKHSKSFLHLGVYPKHKLRLSD